MSGVSTNDGPPPPPSSVDGREAVRLLGEAVWIMKEWRGTTPRMRLALIATIEEFIFKQKTGG